MRCEALGDCYSGWERVVVGTGLRPERRAAIATPRHPDTNIGKAEKSHDLPPSSRITKRHTASRDSSRAAEIGQETREARRLARTSRKSDTVKYRVTATEPLRISAGGFWPGVSNGSAPNMYATGVRRPSPIESRTCLMSYLP
jgi:hypothetical protein